MAWLQNGTAFTSAGGTIATVTVPAGITSGNYAVFTSSGDQKASTIGTSTPSSSNGTANIQTIFNTADINNSYLSVFYVTGLAAGDTFTVTTGANSNQTLSHFYFDAPLVTWGSLGARGGVTQNYVVAPATTVTAGSTVYVYAMSRYVGSNGLTSAVNSNGRTLTSLYSNYESSSPYVNINLLQFTETSTSTGTTTVTETASSGNAGAFHFAESSPSTAATAAWVAGAPTQLSYDETVLTDGAVAYWPLQETSGTTATDLTGSGLNLTYKNSPILNQPAIAPGLGASVLFNATSSHYLESANPTSTVSGSYSVEVWCMPTATAANAVYTFFSTREQGDYSFDAKLNAASDGSAINLIHGDVGTGTAWIDTSVNASVAISANSANHIVYTIDSGVGQVYLNGTLVNSDTLGGAPLLWDSTHIITIATMNGSIEFFQGYISNVAVYDTVLTATQIANHYAIGSSA